MPVYFKKSSPKVQAIPMFLITKKFHDKIAEQIST